MTEQEIRDNLAKGVDLMMKHADVEPAAAALVALFEPVITQFFVDIHRIADAAERTAGTR